MTRALIVIAAFFSLAGTAALAAPPADKGKPESPGKSAAAPGQSAEQNAAKKCKAERAKGAEAFKNTYGTNGNKANAFGKCVSKLSKDKPKAEGDEDENEANESKAEESAAKKCKAERAKGAEAFKNTYGTNHNKANAFGKCVSKLSKAQTS
jgi:hypothetical protein